MTIKSKARVPGRLVHRGAGLGVLAVLASAVAALALLAGSVVPSRVTARPAKAKVTDASSSVVFISEQQSPFLAGYEDCLDTNAEGSVYVDTCSASPSQSWLWVGGTLVNGQYNNYCLDSNDAGDVYTDSCNGGNYQFWIQAQNGNYVTLSDQQTNRCLYVEGGPVLYSAATESCNATPLWETVSANEILQGFASLVSTGQAVLKEPDRRPGRNGFTRLTG